MLTNASFNHEVSEDIEPADVADGSLLPTNERFMAAAVMSAMSGVNLKEGGPFGASIVRDGVLVCSAHNTFFADCDPTCHAEMNAVRLAMRRLETLSTLHSSPAQYRFTAAKNGVDYLSFYDAILPHTKRSNSPPMTCVNPPSSYEDERIISMLTSPDHCIIVNKDNDIIANSDSSAIDDFTTDPVDTPMSRISSLMPPAYGLVQSPFIILRKPLLDQVLVINVINIQWKSRREIFVSSITVLWTFV
ncbi:hypothetical protein FOZ62_021590 [Perkinsus olseni]|uniref:CMP/dCMP-type deaminase domain-containing protein n=1 Tax=Perkinsus olseni TaxID=32597 RepID=A0A7J6TFE4_PEROL|nr:hypothetical protein FOZ62_021590 [Perkinsus olseni]